jgi:cation diffusion facilitator family transporter
MGAPGKQHRGATLTVLLALAANVGVAVVKAVAGTVTGSAALMSEAAHSVGDTVTEVLLLAAVRRSRRPADRRHPFGYGQERYFWSLLAAIGILVSGAAFSFYEGYGTLSGRAPSPTRPGLGYLVLGLSAVLEAASFVQGVRRTRGEATVHRSTMVGYLREPRDPTVKSVVLEDSAAMIGIALAFLGIFLHHVTGQPAWDGAAALAIGALLVAVAFELARTNMGLLIGQQAPIALVRAVWLWLAAQPEVEKVVDMLTMMVGIDRILLCARLDFRDTLGAAELEATCVRFDSMLREEFPDLDEVFLTPVPRDDPYLHLRVRARYGEMGG